MNDWLTKPIKEWLATTGLMPPQNESELAEFLDFVRELAPRSYLEIGAQFGATIWEVARCMPRDSRIVAVDLPTAHTKSEPVLRECFQRLGEMGYETHLIIGDSTSPKIVEQVRTLAPFDLIFIDANHTERHVRSDFANYGGLAKTVCLHDIGWTRPVPPGRRPIEVRKVWLGLKQIYRDGATFREIRHDADCNGIGILQWNN